MSATEIETQTEEVVKRGRGRPPLTDEQRLERDRKRYEQQRAYYVANKERIAEQQKKMKSERYQNDPEFRKKAIDYITVYNKRRAAIVNFAMSWKDEAFKKALQNYLFQELEGDD
jgi:hypothetical protein